MQINHVLLGFALAVGASARCSDVGGYWCYWDRRCQTYNRDIGTVDPQTGYKVEVSTKYSAVGILYHRTGQIGENCYNDYGGGCLSGWARLWCKQTE